jgi:hypothetical protein
MARKNYRNEAARRKHVVQYTPSEFSADWEVLMTNGSGVKRVELTGSRVSAWNYAIRLGLNEHDETMPGVWWPVDMTMIRENSEAFSVV